jgi:hypothetical protein
MSHLSPGGVPPPVPPFDADGIGLKPRNGTMGRKQGGRTHVRVRAHVEDASTSVPLSHFFD